LSPTEPSEALARPNAHPLTSWLSRQGSLTFAIYAISAAFSCYFCMYAFRKPFTAVAYEGAPTLMGLDYKIALILAQLFGYTASKFLGVKVISELDPRHRPLALVALIGFAELTLVGFGLSPAEWGPLWLFLNGLPLGMIWGLVFGFLEGRKLTEVLGAGLSASYILASGVVKSVGGGVITWGITERWMPAVTGILFLLPFTLCVYLLWRLPPPSAEDEALRTKRGPMDGASRWAILRHIELPKLKKVLLIAILLRFIDSFMIYVEPLILTKGGPGTSTVFISHDLMRNAAQQFDLGRSAAISLIYFAIILAITWVIYRAMNPKLSQS